MYQDVLFYDGECGFCNKIVSFILKNEKNNKLKFAALQSQYATEVLSNYCTQSDYLDSFKIKTDTAVLEKGRAFFYLVRYYLKPRFYPLLVFNILPLFLINKVYDVIAKNRMFLGQNSCFLPNSEQKLRFL